MHQFLHLYHDGFHTRYIRHNATHRHTHTHTQPFYGSLEFVRDYLGEPVPEKTFTHSHLSESPIILYICFLHLLRSMASSLFNLRVWQSFSITSVQLFFEVGLGLAPSTSYSIYFFTQSLSSFQSTCPYNRNQFCCSSEIISSNPSLSLNCLLGTLSFYLNATHTCDHSHHS